MTLARSDLEARLLRRSLRALSRSGLPLYVGEGGSDASFVRRIARLPNIHVCPSRGQTPGLVGQLRAAFDRAHEDKPDFVLYTEPDKLAFFRSGLELLAGAAQTGDGPPPGIVLACRSPRGFATFPEGQRAAESIMNRLCSEAFDAEGDYTYGPMLIHERLLRYIPMIPEDQGWGWRFFIMAIAHQLRMRLGFCPVLGACPFLQRGEDDLASRSYRLRQLVQNVSGLGNGWIGLLHQPFGFESLLAEA